MHDCMSGSLITPSKDSVKHMRRIGALGMEDPVFGTVERGPSHPSQIYDDMSFGDVPTDMRDLISIASDPTAEMDNGVDSSIFHSSLGDLHLSLSDFSQTELLGASDTYLQSLGASASEKVGSRSRRGTKDTYISAKVDPWGINYRKKKQTAEHSDATATSETRSVTSAVSLTLLDLGASPPSPKSPVNRNNKVSRWSPSSNGVVCGAPLSYSGPVTKFPHATLSNQSTMPDTNVRQYKNALYWNSPYHFHPPSIASGSTSSNGVPACTGHDNFALHATETCGLGLSSKQKRRSSTGDKHMVLSASIHRRSSILVRSRSECILGRPVDFDKEFDKHNVLSRRHMAHLEAMPSKENVKDYGAKCPSKTWLDGVAIISDTIPEGDGSDPNTMADVVVEKRSDDGVACPYGPSSTKSIRVKPAASGPRRTPFVVECASTKGMEPRLLPTIASIFNHHSTAGPTPRAATKLVTGTPSYGLDQYEQASPRDRRTTMVKPTSIHSFYDEDDDETPRVVVREPCHGSPVRESGRYFESTHAVKSITSMTPTRTIN
ncbi:hypothetical protein ACA910_012909 [Epithemia clementina (nom. ined.)]